MSTDVPFPALSKEKPDTEGVLSTWFVADGEQVTEDQLIAEVQVDKVSAEVAAPCDGVITLLVKEDEPVVQGAAIARIA
jgi:pyruvate/2-oxoglutarate dehydrogenase complex dihydrolipoamide acyltransferase (E2) component